MSDIREAYLCCKRIQIEIEFSLGIFTIIGNVYFLLPYGDPICAIEVEGTFHTFEGKTIPDIVIILPNKLKNTFISTKDYQPDELELIKKLCQI